MTARSRSRGAGLLARARRLDDAVEVRAARRFPALARRRDLTPAQAAAWAFCVSALLMTVIVTVVRLGGGRVSVWTLAGPVVGITVGSALGARLRRRG